MYMCSGYRGSITGAGDVAGRRRESAQFGLAQDTPGTLVLLAVDCD
jgi:hypothetical protein